MNKRKSKTVATAKAKTSCAATAGSALDSYHYHEAMDRLSVILDTFEKSICEHPVTQKHGRLSRLCSHAADALISCYQEAARLSYDEVPNGLDQRPPEQTKTNER